jgi:hypothetical protein
VPPPAYAGSTWTSGDVTTDDHFASLANWNYGLTDDITSGSGGGYVPWGASGTAPYLGSTVWAPDNQATLSYDVPGNVSQTTDPADPSLFSTYSPQAFSSSGCGVTITATYTGNRTWNTEPYGSINATWTSGAINTYNKVSFPTDGRTEVYVQIKAQMMSTGASDNGAWDALWLLGQGNEDREIDLQETGVCGQATNLICSHLQTPPELVDDDASSSSLSTGYHLYGVQLDTVTGIVNFYLDNVEVGSASLNQVGPYFLLMDGEVSSGLYFSAPGTNSSMSMNVADVQVYQR